MESNKNAEEQSVDVGKGEDSGYHSLGLLFQTPNENYTRKSFDGSYEITFPVTNVECFSTNEPAISYHTYESENNSVLIDLDKGVTIETGKSDPFATLACDNQILQRYLHDASISLCKENSHGQHLYVPRPPLMTGNERSKVVEPPQREIKYSECDFNSSDSFESIESIIPKTIQCELCPKTFMFKSDLTRHKKNKHTPRQKFTCYVCKKDFVCNQNLLIHERSHKVSNLRCEECKQSFKNPKLYKTHMQEIHNNDNPFQCPLCQIGHKNLKEMIAHQTEEHNHNSKQYFCIYCKISFKKKKNFTAHMKLHSASFNCSKSGNKSTKKVNCKGRVKKDAAPDCVEIVIPVPVALPTDQYQPDTYKGTVSRDTTTSCKKCALCFANASELKKHTRTHRKTFTCPECFEEFPTRKAMSLHISARHIRPTNESCTQTDLFELQTVNLEEATRDPLYIEPFTTFNAVPLIISQPSAVPVPYSTCS